MNELMLTNRALRLAKLDTINSLDDTNNAVAAYCRENMQSFIDELLMSKDWSFAKVRKPLVQLNLSFSDWDYVYDLPDDMIRYQHIVEPDINHRQMPQENVDYEIFNDESFADGASSRLASNAPALDIVYTKRVTVVERIPDYFSTAVSYLYAYYLATTFGGSERASWAFQMFAGREAWAFDLDNKMKRKNIRGVKTLTNDPVIYDPWGYSK